MSLSGLRNDIANDLPLVRVFSVAAPSSMEYEWSIDGALVTFVTLLSKIRTVAITTGSRGIHRASELCRAISAALARTGVAAIPPAMGNHGGATPGETAEAVGSSWHR